ncbi:SIMPL domain-containing protein [Streptomyces sp. NBC_01275]|uniref:SIMPL domain-containing protein n=1 Tax=Streptomyces sp. NBC_01275 TaxID=2903807 RepID=UPI002253C960|nr:SIMPL domain-containing protein [Streptomyces sp. NBC_01275]MCX4761233.1 SIMPL domain-containing protein [Streptomyces sp. NBC_01275]
MTSQPPPPPPYGTPDAPLLTVRGEADLEVDPEIARIAVTVTARGKDRRTTLDDLTHRNTTVLDLIKSYGDAVENLATGSVTLTPELAPRGRGERIRTYHGNIHLTAELTDFTALGELTTRLADLELTRIDGPWWQLRPTSPVHRQARQQAVHEAVQRAKEYADALGTTITALIELADAGATAGRPRSAFDRRAVRFSMAAAETEQAAEPLDLEPQRIHIRAEVNAQFTMHPPSL